VTENQTPEPNPAEEQAATTQWTPPAATTPEAGSPQPATAAAAATSRRSTWLAVGAGVAVAGVALGGVAVGAALADRHGSDDMGFQRSAPVAGSTFGRDGGQGPGGLLGDRMQGGSVLGGALGGLRPDGALHGEVVFQDASGDYVTMTVQQGDVTDVSATSISLDSADGFSATYVIDDQTRAASPDADPVTDGMAGIKVGDTVNVVATQTDGTGTAQLVLEGGFGPGFGPMGREAA
jgi:hypothetical protein